MAAPQSQRRPSHRGETLLGHAQRSLKERGLDTQGADDTAYGSNIERLEGTHGSNATHGSNDGCVGSLQAMGARGSEVLNALERGGLWAVQLKLAASGTTVLSVVDGEGTFAKHVLVNMLPAKPTPPPSPLRRHWRQWRYPLGVSLALLGPDGTGKSTVAAACCARLRHLFSAASVQHLRPSLLPELSRLVDPRQWGRPRGVVDATDPHGKPAASALSSLLRLAYYSGDYLLGYLPRVRWPSARGELLMFDRYHADLLADPLRWRIGLPEAPRRLAVGALPLPDLVVLLDGPAPLLHARKAELPVEEIARQSAVYRELVGSLSNGHLVSVEQTPELVCSAVCKLIARRQASRVRRRLEAAAASGDN